MAVTSVKVLGELEGAHVLAPERYDPRRASRSAASGVRGSVPLRSLVASVRQTVSAGKRDKRSCIVLDTSDAQEGIVVNRKRPILLSEIGSTKKITATGDVLISRLRPYLRQVAFVDGGLRFWQEGVQLLCSTEFFVLGAVDEGPIAFLVPFLLTQEVQKVLAAAQEGGHHPRFNETTLLGLPVPKSLVERRQELSREVERSVQLFRQSEQVLLGLTADADKC